MSGLIEARIVPEWAEGVARDPGRIFAYNRYSAEDIGADVDLSALGGLLVRVSEMTFKPDEVREILGRTSCVNLAFGEVARLTTTGYLLDAAREAEDRRGLVEDLRARQASTDEHGPDETWVLPLWSLKIGPWR